MRFDWPHIRRRMYVAYGRAYQWPQQWQIPYWVRGLWHHVWHRGWYGLLLLAGFAAAWLGPLLVWWLCSLDMLSETHMRGLSMVLQVLGVGTVAVGISETRKLFDRTSIIVAFFEWFKQLPEAWSRPKPTAILVPPDFSNAHDWSSTIVENPPEEAAIEEQVKWLLTHYHKMNDELQALKDEFRSQGNVFENQLTDEKKTRKLADKNLQEKMKDAFINGLHLEFVGLVWLLAGIITGLFPDWFGLWLSWL